jgi:hypothetical protein
MELSRRYFLKTGIAGASAVAAVSVAGNVAAAQTVCLPSVWDLTAGQTSIVGTVTVTNDNKFLYIQYDLTTANAAFGTLHLWVGNLLANIPSTPNGTPIPGQFPYSFEATGQTTHTFVIPLSELALVDVGGAPLCGAKVFVVTHAEVDLDGDGTGEHETAFGGPNPGEGPRWWFYGQYTICCPDVDPPPPPVRKCQTAFGRLGKNEGYQGGDDWVFVGPGTKANPEKLSMLGLTQNRWGWAVRLDVTGTYTGPIYAGAGLNDIRKGVLIGSIKIVWDGDKVTITYKMSSDYPNASIYEAHVYASTSAPATIAPGQFGNTYYFDPDANQRVFDTTIDVEPDGDVLWVIAHAVVCR